MRGNRVLALAFVFSVTLHGLVLWLPETGSVAVPAGRISIAVSLVASAGDAAAAPVPVSGSTQGPASTAAAVSTADAGAGLKSVAEARSGPAPASGPDSGSRPVSESGQWPVIASAPVHRSPLAELPTEVPDSAAALVGNRVGKREAGQAVGMAGEPPEVADEPVDSPGHLPARSVQAAAQGPAAPARKIGTAELSGLLNRAIQARARYPAAVRRSHREGTTTVAFRLHPDGDIDAVAIEASSGVSGLDRSALRAVAAITPFAEARHYLQTAQLFRVDIVFRLGTI